MCTWVKLLTDLQILGCELHKNAFGGRTPHEPDGRVVALPQTLSRYKGEGRERRKGKGLGIGRGGRGEGGAREWRGERIGKGEIGARLGYLPGGPRLTPLHLFFVFL